MASDKRKKAFSLTEVMVSMVVFSALIFTFTQLIISAMSISNDIYQRGRFRENVLDVMDAIRRDIRNASKVEDCNAKTCKITVEKVYIWTTCAADDNTQTAICKYEETSPGNNTLIKKSSPDIYINSLDFKLIPVDSAQVTDNNINSTSVIVTLTSAPINTAADKTNIVQGRVLFDVRQSVISTRNVKL